MNKYGTYNYISVGVASPDNIDSTPRVQGDVQERISPNQCELPIESISFDCSSDNISDTFLVRSI